MMEWALVITVWVQGFVSVTQIEMYDRRDCEVAAAAWREDIARLGNRGFMATAVCLQKRSYSKGR